MKNHLKKKRRYYKKIKSKKERTYGRNRYLNMRKGDKLTLKEYQKNYRETKKSTFFTMYKIKKELIFKTADNKYSVGKYFFKLIKIQLILLM